MSVRVANSTEAELSVGSGLDLESRSFQQRYFILGWDNTNDALAELAESELEVTYPQGYVTDAYLDSLDNLVGCVNSVKWRRWEAGSIKYKGAEYEYGNSLPTRITHLIGMHPNLVKFTAAGIKGITKDG